MSKQNILIIDDDETIVEILKQTLEDSGFTHVAAYNGQEGIDTLIEQDNIDGVILDIMMPVMDGRETLIEIRKHQKIKGVPVLILTGQTGISDVSEFFTLGANDYMVKPFDKETLIARLQKILPLTVAFE